MVDGRTDVLDEAEAAFTQVRPRLFGIAYRMLGSAAEAEDVVQDVWLRWQRADRGQVRDPNAFLATITTRLAINALQSARARRESYVGPWLPEPVDTSADPALGAEREEALAFATLLLLERLTPTERAAYVLREAFAYSPREVAELIGSSEANARQLHSRARRHVARDEARTVDPKVWADLVQRFFAAAREGDVESLETMLADDVVSAADGGGVVKAARRVVEGRTNVARYLAGLLTKFWEDLDSAVMEVNGEPAVVSYRNGSLRSVWFVETDGAVVSGLRLVVNPEKLAYLDRQLSRTAGSSGL